jgi:Leucine-rich repeat (LRR) protein
MEGLNISELLCGFMDDEVQHIFSYVPHDDLFKKVSLTCSHFRELTWKSLESYIFRNQMKELHKQNIFHFVTENCPHLKQISVYSIVTDEVIDQLSFLDKLSELKLVRCGEFSEVSFKKISEKFKFLKHLTANRIKCEKGIKHLSTMEKLTSVQFTFCIPTILKELSCLPHLQELDLSYSNVSKVDFSKFTNLKKLKISNSNIKMIWFRSLTSLKELDVSSSFLEGDYDSMVALNHLEKLNLQNCKDDENIIQKHLISMQFLKELNISKYKVFSELQMMEIIKLPSLKVLTANILPSMEFLRDKSEIIPKGLKIYIF